jgi:segregation and condensation protein B
MTDQGTDHDVDLEARRAIEAVILVATRVEALCNDLADEYEREGRGFVLARVAGGYRFQTHPAAAPYVERFVLDGQHARLSGPALETLAIVAYKQPISRAQLSAIRGVNVDATLRTLVARGYVEEIGHEHSPGNPVLFATTTIFLERLGIDGLDQLPALGDFVPDAGIVETLERGLRLPGDRDAAPVLADDEESTVDVEHVLVEKVDVADVTPVAAELQAGLDNE